MSYLHLGNDYGTMIHTPDGFTIRQSKTLRGMRDYARVSPVAIVETTRDPANNVRGVLRVQYENGNYSIASFASYHVMIDFVRNRRTWRNAKHVMKSENMGHLTKPGKIAGAE